jgi:dihydrofolate reductase
MIVAIGNNREIGRNNDLLWHIPEDLKNFKKLTLGHHIIMGRKTFESIGRPLPGRHTIIVTTQEDYSVSGCITVHSLEEALDFAKEANESEVFICGGGAIYELALPKTEKLYLSRVDYSGEADVYFPDFERYNWQQESSIKHHAGDYPAWKFETLSKETEGPS